MIRAIADACTQYVNTRTEFAAVTYGPDKYGGKDRIKITKGNRQVCILQLTEDGVQLYHAPGYYRPSEYPVIPYAEPTLLDLVVQLIKDVHQRNLRQ